MHQIDNIIILGVCGGRVKSSSFAFPLVDRHRCRRRSVGSSHRVHSTVNVNKVPFSFHSTVTGVIRFCYIIIVGRFVRPHTFDLIVERLQNITRNMSRRTDLDLSDDQRFALMKVRCYFYYFYLIR